VKLPKPSQEDGEDGAKGKPETEVPLPQTLVRIPVEQEPETIQTSGASEKRNEA
jgi:hypothetical protein